MTELEQIVAARLARRCACRRLTEDELIEAHGIAIRTFDRITRRADGVVRHNEGASVRDAARARTT